MGSSMVTPDGPSIIFLMPVYEDKRSASALLAALSKLPLQNIFVVVVEDGSTIEELSTDDIRQCGLEGEILYLRRNVGHQRAIAVGLMHLSGSHAPTDVVVMDSDGEDEPSSALQLLEELKRGSGDVVVARRRQRSESLKFRGSYLIYQVVFKILTGRSIHFGNFVALSPRALRRLAAMQETGLHFPGAIISSKLRTASIPIDRGKRYFGQSKLNFVGLALHGIRSMMVFAEDILVRVGMSCVALTMVSIVLIAVAGSMKVLGYASPGWFTTVAGVLLILVMQSGILTFVTLMMSGIIRGSASVEQSNLHVLIDRIASTRNV
jgi:polyisoprenyl-phosphate glycosyltransferase